MKDKKAGSMDNSALKSLVDSLSQMAGMQHSDQDAHIVGKGKDRMYDLRFLDSKFHKKKGKDDTAKDSVSDFKKMLADAKKEDAKIETTDPDAVVDKSLVKEGPMVKGSGKKALDKAL